MIPAFDFSRSRNLDDVLADLERDEQPVEGILNIAVAPPQEAGNAESDVDSLVSGDEGADGAMATSRALHHLPRRLLRSEAVVTVRHAEGESSDEEEIEVRAKPRKKTNLAKWKKPGSDIVHMRMADMVPPPRTRDQQIMENLFEEVTDEDDVLSAFKMFFDEKMLDKIIEETNRYAEQKNDAVRVTRNEMLVVLGIILFSGYRRVPSTRMYWEEQPDVSCDLVKDAIRRDRFEKILRYFHLADNTKINEDRFFKVRDFFDALNKNLKCFPKPKRASIDETMVPYYGRHSAKQFIRSKPIRFGYKIWGAADPDDGWMLHVEPYCGKSTKITQYPEFGQGGSVVLGLLEACDFQEGTELYFDNLFSSVALLEELTKRKMKATGTLRENRVGKHLDLPDKKTMSKRPRGESEMRVNPENSIVVVRWMDNSVVTMLSNCYSVGPVKRAERYDRIQKQKVKVMMPDCIDKYNTNMGGNDNSDQAVANLRPSVRIRKWWWPLFNYGLTLAAVQGWLLRKRLYADRLSSRKLQQIDFRRSLCMELIGRFGQKGSGSGRPSRLIRGAHTAIRYDPSANHIIFKTESKYGRCQLCNDGRRSSYACRVCNVVLHVDCFEAYHNSD